MVALLLTPMNFLMKCWNSRSRWAYCMKLKSGIKKFCQKANCILHRATKWINYIFPTSPNKLYPGQFAIWNCSWPPRFWRKFGSLTWNSLESKTQLETFHAANLNVFYITRWPIWLNGFTRRFSLCGNKKLSDDSLFPLLLLLQLDLSCRMKGKHNPDLYFNFVTLHWSLYCWGLFCKLHTASTGWIV